MFLDFGVKFDIFAFCCVWYFFAKNVNLKNGMFKICFRQSAKCKMTAQTMRKYHVFVNICNLGCILPSKRRFVELRPLLHFLCLINSFYRRCVASMYNRSDRSNRLTRFNRSNLTEQQQFKK